MSLATIRRSAQSGLGHAQPSASGKSNGGGTLWPKGRHQNLWPRIQNLGRSVLIVEPPAEACRDEGLLDAIRCTFLPARDCV